MAFLGPIPGGNNSSPPVTVEIERLEPTDSNAKYAPIEEFNGVPSVWTDYTVVNRYEYNPSIYMNGLTAPVGFDGKSVSFVQLASPTLLLVSDWTACRLNAIPTAPSINPPEDWFFMWAAPETAPIGVKVDGETPIYRLSGTYVFGHKNPKDTVFAHVVFPISPAFQDVFSRRIAEGDFQTNIIFANTTNILRGAVPIR